MLNIAAVMGRLAADPELKHTPGGVAVTSFTAPSTRPWSWWPNRCPFAETRQKTGTGERLPGNPR